MSRWHRLGMEQEELPVAGGGGYSVRLGLNGVD